MRTFVVFVALAVALLFYVDTDANERRRSDEPYTVTALYYHGDIRVIVPSTPPYVMADERECEGLPPGIIVDQVQVVREWPNPLDPGCGAPGSKVAICIRYYPCAESIWQPGVDEYIKLEIRRREGETLVVARFVRQSQPVEVTLTGWSYRSGHASCSLDPYTQEELRVSAIGRFWPSEYAKQCSGLGVAVTATFETLEYGSVAGTFVWHGNDLTFDVPVEPAEMPATGGPP